MESDLPMVEGSRRWYRTLRPLAIDVREENERLRILAEMEASMRIYSMLANLPPVPPNMLPLSEH
jgi:hypothetical protein